MRFDISELIYVRFVLNMKTALGDAEIVENDAMHVSVAVLRVRSYLIRRAVVGVNRS